MHKYMEKKTHYSKIFFHFYKKLRTFFVICGLLLSGWALIASAQVMQSTNYKLQVDSANAGGLRSSSANYVSESTSGEVATGESASTNYKIKAGYQQMMEVYLAMTAAASVTMSPAIGGVTGGTGNGNTSVTVTTDNAAGYQMSIQASSSPALISGANSFSDYAPAGANPDFLFSILPSASAFGFSPEGVDILAKYKDNGSACNTGTGDTVDRCWEGLSTTSKILAQSIASNQPAGTLTTIKFRAQAGASRLQQPGTYTATSTITTIAL